MSTQVDDLSEWRSFFDEAADFVEGIERQYGVANERFTEYAIDRLELTVQSCSAILDRFISATTEPLGEDDRRVVLQYREEMQDMISVLRRILQQWHEYRSVLDSGASSRYLLSYRSGTTQSGRGRGRPRFDVSIQQVQYLKSLFFTWSEIAALLGVSRMTLYRRRVEFGMVNDASMSLSNADLLSLVREIHSQFPTIGASMMWGHIRARGYHVTREQVRSSLRRVDPLSAALRWPGGLTVRRPYSVAGPNSLWHIDSHHKLIRWRFVVHAGIDGYSRLITYMQCSTNNRASTVYELFLKAVEKHKLPSRVRSDQGRENMLVAQHMIESRGAERRSMITGSSVHNQRIERLWRDMHHSVTVLFYKLFYFMEHNDMLDPLSERHLYALHYVFLPRINHSLSTFIEGWNHHPIRTAHHHSPHKIFTAGALLLQHSQLAALDFFGEVDDTFGLDPDAPPAVHTDGNIVVPGIDCRLDEETLTRLRHHIDPLSTSDNYGMDLYDQALEIITGQV